jgi:DNA-directed RNA polymerase specialized sigma24 family protein
VKSQVGRRPINERVDISGAGAITRPQVRDEAAILRFDAFLFSAAATVLVTRAFLAGAGYPQVGGSSQLHIAHVLWGGLLLAGAVVVFATSLGSQAKLRASVLGGIGFGLFVDEIGKFLTKDVNYFFQPAIAIIYAILVLGYLGGRYVLLRRGVSPARAKAIAAAALTDWMLGELTPNQRRFALAILTQHTASDDVVAAALAEALRADDQASRRRSAADYLTRTRQRLLERFLRVARHRAFRRSIIVVLIAQAAGAVGSAVYELLPYTSVTAGAGVAALGTVISAAVAGAVVMAGLALRLARKRGALGLELIRAGLALDLLVVDVFKFTSDQLGALSSFAVHAVLLSVINAWLAAGSPEPVLGD